MKERFKGWLAGIIHRLIAVLTLGQISPLLGTGMVVEQDGRILVVKRSDGRGYNVPGGIVRYRETVEQCALREAYEETGYHVRITGLVGVYSSHDRDPRFRSVAIVYKGALVSGSLQASGEGQPSWRLPEEIFGQMAFDNEAIVRDYLAGHQRFS
jgi:ADP-ribose pyrophosphatase YjhB (NUDIX family)